MPKAKHKSIRPEDAKLREAILYLSILTERDKHCGAIKLNKLLFYSDFIAYRRFGKPITGQEYQRLTWGPCARRMKPVLEVMEAVDDIATREESVFGRFKQKRTFAKRTADLSQFSAAEVALFHEMAERFRDTNATDISDLSHDFIGWQLAKDGETIPYGTVLIGTRKPTEHEIKIGQHLKKFAREALARNAR